MAYIGNVQFLPGYCVLFAEPQVASLNDLGLRQRSDFLFDMSLLGDAITAVCKPARLNYGILGNSHPHLHAHLFPRFEWEPDERRQRNVWTYPEKYWVNEDYIYTEAKNGVLKTELVAALQSLLEKSY